MPDQPREPEFLPDWYARRLTRSRRCRMLVRAAVALSLAGAAGAALLPGRAPAVVAEGAALTLKLPDNDPAEPGARHKAGERRGDAKLPPGARRALQALHDVLPPGVAIEQLAFRNERGVTTVSLSCTAGEADAADELAEALRGLWLFADVRLETAAGAEGRGDPSRPSPNSPIDFNVRATVTAAEAQ